MKNGVFAEKTGEKNSNRFMYRWDWWWQSIDILIIYGSNGQLKMMPNHFTVSSPMLSMYWLFKHIGTSTMMHCWHRDLCSNIVKEGERCHLTFPAVVAVWDYEQVFSHFLSMFKNLGLLRYKWEKINIHKAKSKSLILLSWHTEYQFWAPIGGIWLLILRWCNYVELVLIVAHIDWIFISQLNRVTWMQR